MLSIGPTPSSLPHIGQIKDRTATWEEIMALETMLAGGARDAGDRGTKGTYLKIYFRIYWWDMRDMRGPIGGKIGGKIWRNIGGNIEL